MNSSKSSKILFRKSTDLAMHPFATSLLHNAIRPSPEAAKRIRFVGRVATGLESIPTSQEELSKRFEKSSSVDETEEENYHHNVFQYYHALSNHINRLEAIQVYFSFTDSLAQKLENYQISIEEWLQYHFANYVLTTISIYDTALCLFNAIARLNINQSPRFEKDIRNKIKGDDEYQAIKLCLDDIKNKVSQHRVSRNSFTHQGQNPYHDELQAINLMDEFNMWRRYFKLENESTTRRRTAQSSRLAVNALIKELAKETDEICQLVLHLFSALQPIYERNVLNQKQQE